MLYLKKYSSSNFLRHLLGWVVYLSYIYLIGLLTDKNLKFYSVILINTPLILEFYANLYWLNFFTKHKVIYSVILFLSFLAVLGLSGYVLIHNLLPKFGVVLYTGSFKLASFLQEGILVYVRCFIYALLFFFIQKSIKEERELRKLQQEKFTLEQANKQQELETALLKQNELKSQQEKLQYEYAFLRAQINPHFLYNTLNVLFSQALACSQSLADNILKLSDMMRYSLESLEYESGKVSVQKELEHLQTLIDINNIRFSNSKMVDYKIKGKVNGQMLPPLSMITIVENAFKYGELKDLQNPLKIEVVLQPKKIYFFCRNKKKKNNFEISSNNIGISNLSRRLDVAFKNKYDMKTTDEEDFYTFELTIND